MSISADPVEREIRDRVLAMILDKKVRKKIAALAGGVSGKPNDSIAVDIRKIERKVARLLLLFEEDELTMVEYKRRKREHEVELRNLESKVTAASMMNPIHGLPTTYDELLDAWEERGIGWQKSIIQVFFDRIPIQRATGPSPHCDLGRIQWPAPKV